MRDIALKGELVSFTTKDGLMLYGLLARPKRKSGIALINVHGLTGNFYRSSYVKALAKAAVAANLNFLTIEERGSYIAFRPRLKNKNSKKYMAGGAFEKFEDSVFDIEGAIRFLGGLGIKKIFLIGHSTGCQKVTYYQYKKKDKRVKAIILLAPADDYNLQKAELGKQFGSAAAFAKRNKNHKDALMPGRYTKALLGVKRFLSFSDLRFAEARLFNYESNKLKEFGTIRQPILALFGDKEEYALKPVREYMKILERDTRSKRFDYLIIKGADHGFVGKEKNAAKAIMRWLGSPKLKK